MLINLQPAILFHRYSDINWTNKHEIMKGYSYIPIREQMQNLMSLNPLHLGHRFMYLSDDNTIERNRKYVPKILVKTTFERT